MPLTEITLVKDGDEKVVEQRERKLYTLAELKDDKHIEDEPSDIITRDVSGAYDTALDKLREWAFDTNWWYEAVLDNDAAELFKACGITVPQKTEMINVKVDGKFQYDENRKPITKTITHVDSIADSWDIERGEFTLNSRARVDEQAFLRALQWYLAGKDIRDLTALQWGQPTPPRPLAASFLAQRKFDLRSKDARIIREQGLAIHEANRWSPRTEFDIDYHYDDVSQQTQEDANELLSDLCHEVISLLRDEMEFRGSAESLLEDADANDYRFTKYGQRA